MHFEIVPRSSLLGPNRAGRGGCEASVRYDKSGRLSFSKRASDAFQPHKLLIAGYDRDARAICFTGVEKPPEGLDEAACYPIHWIKGKNLATHCTLSARRLLERVGFKAPVCMDFAILNINLETHSIILQIPDLTAETGEQDETDRPHVNGEDHAAV